MFISVKLCKLEIPQIWIGAYAKPARQHGASFIIRFSIEIPLQYL